MSIVIDTTYRSTLGRKPASPAFYFPLHNDAAGGTALVDRFGNARYMFLAGTVGTSWSKNRGYLTLNGTDQQALGSTGTGQEYAGQDVMANALLTPGRSLYVGWLIRWDSAKTSANETVIQLGRSNANSASMALGHNNTGIINFQARGVGASATTSQTFGPSSSYLANTEHACMVHCRAVQDGFRVTAYLDGVSIGSALDYLWTNNGGAAPTLATFAHADGVNIGALDAGASSGSPSWLQRVGASTTQNTRLTCIWAVNTTDDSAAQALALEAHQYRRQIGAVLAGL
jgi:hypothetical protein